MSEPFSTIGGVATKDEAYRKLTHHLEEAQNQALVIGHFYNTEDDNVSKLLAKGWYGVGEMIQMMRRQVREIMMKRMQ
jgi:hypothetical protein